MWASQVQVKRKMNPLTNLRALKSPLLVTGHTGFKGAWLGLILDMLEIPFIGISLPPLEDSLYSRIDQPTRLEAEYFQDIREYAAIQNIFQDHQPEAVLHMAAQPLVIDSYKDPISTFSTNVMGTAHVLEAARSISKRCHIGVITTDKVYRNLESAQKFVETDPLQGFDPYSASKAAAENVISAWKSYQADQSKIVISALRAGNVIGGGDTSENRLIPDLIKAFQRGDEPSIRNPEAIRPWQHVIDPLIGYLFALEHSITSARGEDFNFGPLENGLEVRAVAELACKSWPSAKELQINAYTNKVHEALYLNLNSDKAQKMLAWTPCWSQEEAVISTIEWWKSLKSNNAENACRKDIEKALKHFEID